MRQSTQANGNHVALIMRPARLDVFQFLGHVTGNHGNEKGCRMERHDVIQFELDAEKKAEQQWKVVDAQPHADGAFHGKVLLLVKAASCETRE